MKNILVLLMLLMATSSFAQNLVFDEVITPIQCNTSKEPAFTSALLPYVQSGKVIEVLADYRDDHNLADFNQRYRTANIFYNGGSSQTPRYGGLFGTRYNEGSIWADNVNGLYNLKLATQIKTDSMLAQVARSGFNLSATYTEVGGTYTVTIKGYAKAVTNTNLIVLLVDNNNHFKACLNGYQGVPVRVGTKSGTVTVKGSSTYSNCKVIALLQDLTNYAPDCVGGSSWGTYERYVYACALAVKK